MSSFQNTVTILRDVNTNVPRPSQGGAGQKRKSDDMAAAAVHVDLSSISCDGLYVDQTCDQVRRKINSLIDSGEIGVGKFCEAIGVSQRSLRTFLGQHGKDKGAKSAVYPAAWRYFKKRELAGIKMPSKKQKMSGGGSEKEQAAIQNIKEAGNSAGADLSNITLPSEYEDAVPVFDSCDEVRKKVNAHLRKPGVTQAQLIRDMQAQLHSPSAQKLQGVQLTRFRGLHGPRRGCSSGVYYAAYVFFEKLRIRENKEKNNHRLGMETRWPNGMSRQMDHGWMTLRYDEYPIEDEFGCITISGGNMPHRW